MKDREKVMENVVTHDEWKACFSELGPGLVLFARQWTRCAADAEDIVQEAFVRFWRRQHPVENRALLFATVRSVALDSIRKNVRREKREADASLESEQSIEPKFEHDHEYQQELIQAIARLPLEQREVLVMKIWNELTFAEIASVLEISQNTAASRYRYALAALKKNFVVHE